MSTQESQSSHEDLNPETTALISGVAPEAPAITFKPTSKRTAMRIILSLTFLLLVALWPMSLFIQLTLDDMYRALKIYMRDNNGTASNASISNVPPMKYAAPFIPMVTDQMDRGVCWAFATVKFIEERYWRQGRAYGFLNDTSYVKFSEQAYAATIIEYCQHCPECCPGTPQASGVADYGFPEWLYVFQDYLQGKLTVSMPECPYIPVGGNDSFCPSMHEFQSDSLLKYSINSYTSLYDIMDVKKSLAESASSFPLFTELMYAPYFLPCDIESLGYGNTDVCLNGTFSCPFDMQNSFGNRTCARLDLRADGTGHFPVRANRKPIPIGSHVMLVVGYTDEYAFDSSSNGMGANANMQRGGFIVANSWGATGSHSVEWFMGTISAADEQYQCPNYQSPRSWVPFGMAGEDIYILRRATMLQYSPTMLDTYHHYPSTNESIETFRQALASVMPVEASALFQLESIDTSVDETVSLTLVLCKGQNPAEPCVAERRIRLPPAPLDLYSMFLRPVNLSDVPNDPSVCGFYLLPYSYVESVRANYGSWWVSDMNMTFTNESFVRYADSHNIPTSTFAYQKIKEALVSKKAIKFVLPLPWMQDARYKPK